MIYHSQLIYIHNLYLNVALTRKSDEDTPRRYGNTISSHAFPVARQSSDCTCYFISYFHIPECVYTFVCGAHKGVKTNNYWDSNLNFVNGVYSEVAVWKFFDFTDIKWVNWKSKGNKMKWKTRCLSIFHVLCNVDWNLTSESLL